MIVYDYLKEYMLYCVFELGIFINNLISFSICNVLFIYGMLKVR